MKSIFVLFFTFLLALLQAQTTFQKSFGGTGSDEAFAGHKIVDGGFILAGNTYAGPNGQCIFLIKTDLFGDTVWTKCYNSFNAPYGYDMKVCSDGGFLIGGVTTNQSTVEDILVIKTDSQGNVIWSNSYGGQYDESCRAITQTRDGNYICTGRRTDYSSYYDALLMKIDPAGNVIWTKTYGGVHQIGNSIDTTNDGGFIIGGEIDTTGAGTGAAFLMRTDSAGNLVWSKAIAGNQGSKGYSVKQTSDGGFILTGETYIPTGPNSVINYVYLLKTDGNGNMQWSKSYGGYGNSIGNSVIQTNDSGYLITGVTSVFVGNGLWTNNLFLIKTDTLGLISWCRYYGGNMNSNDRGNYLEQTPDGGYIMSGVTSDTWYNAYLLKTDSMGNVGCNGYFYPLTNGTYQSSEVNPTIIEASFTINANVESMSASHFICAEIDPCSVGVDEIGSVSPVHIFPNPGTEIFTLSGIAPGSSIEIFDITGNKILELVSGSQSQTIDLTTNAKGIYFYKVSSDKETQYGKFLLIE